MEIIGITGQKGGSGKSTLTVNLAAWFALRGFAVSVLDRDAQGAIKRWESRGEGLPFMVESNLNVQLGNVVSARRRQGDDIVLIDTAPSIGGAFREVPKIADLILLPTKPSPMDIDSLNTAYEILTTEFERKKVYAVLMQAFRRFTITDESVSALKELEIPCLKTRLMHRTIYQTSSIDGRTVLDGRSNKAAKEIEALGKEVAALLGLSLTRKKRRAS